MSFRTAALTGEEQGQSQRRMRQLGLKTLAPSHRSGIGPGFQYSEQSAGAARLKSIRISRTEG